MTDMETFTELLEQIDSPQHRKRMEELFAWVANKFPELEPVVKWQQPMYTHHDTYIIGFSLSKKHMSVAPEMAGINQFAEEIKQSGFEHTKNIVRIPWDKSLDYSLLEKMIAFNITDKANCSTFWR